MNIFLYNLKFFTFITIDKINDKVLRQFFYYFENDYCTFISSGQN